jgi:hypothetical protein
LFQSELFYSCFIRCDGGTFDTDFTLFDCFGSVNGDLIIGLVSVLDTEIKVLDWDINEWSDELLFDGLPDDSGHFISIEFYDWIFDCDFGVLHFVCF